MPTPGASRRTPRVIFVQMDDFDGGSAPYAVEIVHTAGFQDGLWISREAVRPIPQQCPDARHDSPVHCRHGLAGWHACIRPTSTPVPAHAARCVHRRVSCRHANSAHGRCVGVSIHPTHSQAISVQHDCGSCRSRPTLVNTSPCGTRTIGAVEARFAATWRLQACRSVRSTDFGCPIRRSCSLNSQYLTLVDLVILGDSIVRRRLSSVSRLKQAATRCSRAREAARYVRRGVDSPMETRLRMLLVLASLPEPQANVRLRDHTGEWLPSSTSAIPRSS
jgi:hypothetical protein